MALVFPASPSLDQTYQQDGAVYEWTGSKWRRMDTFQNSIVTEYTNIVEYTANTVSIEPDKYNYFKITVDEDTTITIPSASSYSNLVVELDLGTVAYTVTWSNNIQWAGGSAPLYNYGYAAKLLLNFNTYDGTNWIGSELLDYTIPVIVPTGEQAYIAPGTYTWVAPEGVTTVSAVAVGGGGTGGFARGFPGNATPRSPGGGAGGGLGWKNSIPVTPGQSYTVVVGASDAASYFISMETVAGLAGATGHDGWNNNYSGSATIAPGGSFVGDGGGTGGIGNSGGFNIDSTTSGPAGGAGGAAGYSGNGGAGGRNTNIGSSGSGGGGGGGGTPTGSSVDFSGNGGGVGIYGEGASGAGGTAAGLSGKGGSGAADPAFGQGTTGGLYGGGGGGAYVSNNTTVYGNAGGNGAVRIIWGQNRSFPSTNAGVL
jgi:hypothetical protein